MPTELILELTQIRIEGCAYVNVYESTKFQENPGSHDMIQPYNLHLFLYLAVCDESKMKFELYIQTFIFRQFAIHFQL